MFAPISRSSFQGSGTRAPVAVAAALLALVVGLPSAQAQTGPEPGPTGPQQGGSDEPAPLEPPAPMAQPAPAPLPAPAPAPMAQPQPAPSTRPAANDQRPGYQVKEQNNRHALGVTGGLSTGSGFAYRRYVGNTMLQGSLWAMILDRGDNTTVWGGFTAARYLLVWNEDRRASVLPDTSALRLVGSASYLYNRSTTEQFDVVSTDPTCRTTRSFDCPSTTKVTDKVERLHTISMGAGIGFEFGAIMRPGFSVSLDLQLTAIFDQKGLSQIWPLPSIALMYSW